MVGSLLESSIGGLGDVILIVCTALAKLSIVACGVETYSVVLSGCGFIGRRCRDFLFRYLFRLNVFGFSYFFLFRSNVFGFGYLFLYRVPFC